MTKLGHRIPIAIYRSISQIKGILQRQNLGVIFSPFLCKAGARPRLRWAILFRVSRSCNLRKRIETQKLSLVRLFFRFHELFHPSQAFVVLIFSFLSKTSTIILLPHLRLHSKYIFCVVFLLILYKKFSW